MSLPFVDPAPTLETWKTHRREVARCRGATCYAALARHFGTDSPVVLEQRVDRREAYCTREGDRAWSGKYRRWRRDGIVPSDPTIAHIKARSGAAVNLARWRDLLLWELLAPQSPSIDQLHAWMADFPEQIRRFLFLESEPDLWGRLIPIEVKPDRVRGLRSLRSLDAFLALLCLARKGEILGYDQQHVVPTRCAFNILPCVLYRHAPLRYRWELLFGCLERVFFRRRYVNGTTYRFPKAQIQSALDAWQVDSRAPLVITSGARNEPLPVHPTER